MTKPTVVSESRIDGFAIASLALSLASVILGPFGFLPGIACGHIALWRIAHDPLRTGKGLAVAGLAIGYLCLAIFAFLLFAYFDSRAKHDISMPI